LSNDIRRASEWVAIRRAQKETAAALQPRRPIRKLTFSPWQQPASTKAKAGCAANLSRDMPAFKPPSDARKIEH
jgi:hypothetical protein